MTGPVILLLRRELRLADNAALAAAIASGCSVLPVFVLDDTSPGQWAAGGASRWWLHHSLQSLATDLAARGATLVLRRGAIDTEISRLAAEIGASAVHAGMPTEPWSRETYRGLRAALSVPLVVHQTSLLFHPDRIKTQAGTPYGVYTPFSRACLAQFPLAPPLPAPSRIDCYPGVQSDDLDSWDLRPTKPDWSHGLGAFWTPGEAGALARLATFLTDGVLDYAAKRDVPSVDGTSRLSPYLAWGEISPRQILHAVADHPARAKFISEILWREFAAGLLWHYQELPTDPLRREFTAMQWHDNPDALRAWQRGQTGIPLVDAGMRQLWQTGWMHNRVRMVVASFLVKHLLIPWQVGQAWFWDTLVDADLAQNAASWQWVAGCGADAAPYFRVFNPALQGARFDPDGAYVRRFVPELAGVADRFIHTPWLAPRPPRNYPAPIIDLATGRDRALAAFAALKKIAV
ncbi:MAG: deoxyribodipyrimidine photo-lyase [Acetobacteraceae bacterium]|nr:deoxyribodipyrimidine photo-lyase [Acetobacteraceae bacterium]